MKREEIHDFLQASAIYLDHGKPEDYPEFKHVWSMAVKTIDYLRDRKLEVSA